MKLMDHLGELRRRLWVVAAVNLLAAALLFQYAAVIMEYLFALNPGMELVYISPQELLLVYIQLSFLAAFVLCSPVAIYGSMSSPPCFSGCSALWRGWRSAT